jgi:heme/copper-type cytochrome/quinol oxidase subunit 2
MKNIYTYYFFFYFFVLLIFCFLTQDYYLLFIDSLIFKKKIEDHIFLYCDLALPGQINFQDPATGQMSAIIDFHNDIFFYLIIIATLVFFLLFMCFVFYTNDDYIHEQTILSEDKSLFDVKYITVSYLVNKINHSIFLEWIFCIIPTTLLYTFVVPSIALLYQLEELPSVNLVVKVTGCQWYWKYSYNLNVVKSFLLYYFEFFMNYFNYDLKYLNSVFNKKSFKISFFLDHLYTFFLTKDFLKINNINLKKSYDFIIFFKKMIKSDFLTFFSNLKLLDFFFLNFFHFNYFIFSSCFFFEGFFFYEFFAQKGVYYYNIESRLVPDSELNIGDPRLLKTNNALLLPKNVPLRFLFNSTDVIHSWALPSFGVKVDCCPGRVNAIEYVILREGRYYGQCSEICGVNHAFMPIQVDVMTYDSLVRYFENCLTLKIFEEKTKGGAVDFSCAWEYPEGRHYDLQKDLEYLETYKYPEVPDNFNSLPDLTYRLSEREPQIQHFLAYEELKTDLSKSYETNRFIHTGGGALDPDFFKSSLAMRAPELYENFINERDEILNTLYGKKRVLVKTKRYISEAAFVINKYDRRIQLLLDMANNTFQKEIDNKGRVVETKEKKNFKKFYKDRILRINPLTYYYFKYFKSLPLLLYQAHFELKNMAIDLYNANTAIENIYRKYLYNFIKFELKRNLNLKDPFCMKNIVLLEEFFSLLRRFNVNEASFMEMELDRLETLFCIHYMFPYYPEHMLFNAFFMSRCYLADAGNILIFIENYLVKLNWIDQNVYTLGAYVLLLKTDSSVVNEQEFLLFLEYFFNILEEFLITSDYGMRPRIKARVIYFQYQMHADSVMESLFVWDNLNRIEKRWKMQEYSWINSWI